MKAASSISRGGFTIVETMIVSAISAIIAVAICSGASACYQFYESMMADTELSLRGRELRDKILFHEVAPHNGVFHTGLLSGTSVSIDTVALNMDCETVGASGTRGSRRLRLMLSGSGNGRCLFEDATRVNSKWLDPGATWVNTDWDNLVDATDLATKKRFYVDLPLSISVRRPLGGTAVLTRAERITVPLFGKVQPTDTSKD